MLMRMSGSDIVNDIVQLLEINVGRIETSNIPGAWDLYRNTSQLYIETLLLSRTEGI